MPRERGSIGQFFLLFWVWRVWKLLLVCLSRLCGSRWVRERGSRGWLRVGRGSVDLGGRGRQAGRWQFESCLTINIISILWFISHIYNFLLYFKFSTHSIPLYSSIIHFTSSPNYLPPYQTYQITASHSPKVQVPPSIRLSCVDVSTVTLLLLRGSTESSCRWSWDCSSTFLGIQGTLHSRSF